MRVVIFGLTAGWLIVGLASLGLLIGLGQSIGSVQYPRAARLSVSGPSLDSLRNGVVQQSAIYYTSDNQAQVLTWYRRYLKPDLDRVWPLISDCIQFADADTALMIRQSIAVMLCQSRTKGTTIYVTRQFAFSGWASSLAP
ncbi:MAG: hypothetical protein ACT4QE_22320 [Anaerolineales bacterium]